MSEAERTVQAAGSIEDSVRRLDVLIGYGYGNLLERLVTVLEKREARLAEREAARAKERVA